MEVMDQKQRRREYNRLYSANNKEQIREKKREYYKKNSVNIREKFKKYRCDLSPEMHLLSNARALAKRYKREIMITVEDISVPPIAQF